MKKPFLSQLAIALLFGVAMLWWAFSALLNELLGDAGWLAMQALALFVVLVLLIEILLRTIELRHRSIYDDRQHQALLGLYTALRPRAPLPTLRTAALSPDTALEYVRLIAQLRPNVIVECGAGVSTVLASLQLEENGTGKVIALDDEQKWAKKTEDDLAEQGVAEWAEVRYAPLKPIEIDDEVLEWYDPQALMDVKRIDMLLIDGPRDLEDRGNRRPALSFLQERFSRDIVIIVDDGNRVRWNNWVHVWAHENEFTVHELFLNEKKSMILFRNDSKLASRL